MFDFVLVATMIIETWFLVLTMWAMGIENGADLGPISILRVVRMAKMARMARMVRLVRAFPELVVLLKGIKAAIRSVVTFSLLWILMIYIYSVVFKQVSDGSVIGRQYFATIPIAMNTLLLRVILPDFADILDEVAAETPYLWPVMISFIMLASITMMNMLTGVLVEVVSVLSAVEKESMMVSHVATSLRNCMAYLEKDTSLDLSHAEFRHLLVQPEIASIVQEAGVDVVCILEQSDLIFESLHEEDSDGEMSFEKFIDTILNMRTANAATVKDIQSNIRVLSKTVKSTATESEDNLARQIGAELTRMRAGLDAGIEKMQEIMQKAQDDADGQDDGDEYDDQQTMGRMSVADIEALESETHVARASVLTLSTLMTPA